MKALKQALKETTTKTVEILRVRVKVLQEDIEGGVCGNPSRCMEKVAIERALRKKDPGIDHKVKIDGGKITFTHSGFRWMAFTPRIAKRELIRFDTERGAKERAKKKGAAFASKCRPHEYTFDATKQYAVKPITKRERARLDQINAARAAREAASGVSDNKRYSLRFRVEGMHPAV